MTGTIALLALLLLAATHDGSARTLLAGKATALDTAASPSKKSGPSPQAPAVQPASNTTGVPRAAGKVQAEAVGLFDYLGALGRQFSGQCVYGRNCGGGCGSSSWVDDLDYACYQHDRCVGYTKSKKCGLPSIPSCDAALASSALSIYARGKCVKAWWQLWCTDTNKVKNAKVVGDFAKAVFSICPY